MPALQFVQAVSCVHACHPRIEDKIGLDSVVPGFHVISLTPSRLMGFKLTITTIFFFLLIRSFPSLDFVVVVVVVVVVHAADRKG